MEAVPDLTNPLVWLLLLRSELIPWAALLWAYFGVSVL